MSQRIFGLCRINCANSVPFELANQINSNMIVLFVAWNQTKKPVVFDLVGKRRICISIRELRIKKAVEVLQFFLNKREKFKTMVKLKY